MSFLPSRSKVKPCKKNVRNCMSGSLCGRQECRGGVLRKKYRDGNSGAAGSSASTSRPRELLVFCDIKEQWITRHSLTPDTLRCCSGKAPDRVIFPTGVAVSSAYELIIVDNMSGRIQKVEKKTGKGTNKLCETPLHVAFHPGTDYFFVVTSNNELIRFDKELNVRSIRQLTSGGRGVEVMGLAVNERGDAFIIRKGCPKWEMYRFGRGESRVAFKNVPTPCSIAVDQNLVYILDSSESAVRIFDYSGVTRHCAIGSRTKTPKAFAVSVVDGEIAVGGWGVSTYDQQLRFQLTVFHMDGSIQEAYQDPLKQKSFHDMLVCYEDRESSHEEMFNAIVCDGDDVFVYRY